MKTLQNIRDVMVVRQAAVPQEFLTSLQAPQLVGWRAKLQELTGQEETAAEILKDTLGELVGGEAEVTRRRQQLNLKRAVHNRRLRRARKLIDALCEDGLQLPEAYLG